MVTYKLFILTKIIMKTNHFFKMSHDPYAITDSLGNANTVVDYGLDNKEGIATQDWQEYQYREALHNGPTVGMNYL